MNTTTRAAFASVAEADVFSSHKARKDSMAERWARMAARQAQASVDNAKFWAGTRAFWTRFNGDRSYIEEADQRFATHLACIMGTTDRAMVDF